jgi:outer membrane protein insertion porin family
MKRYYLSPAFILLMLFLFSACSTSRFVPAGEKLYTGGEVKMDSEEAVKGKAGLKSELEDLLRPEENSKILGMRIGAWSYYKNQQEKTGFIARYIYKKLGEEPVYLSDVEADKTMNLILNRLENRGYFFSELEHEINEKNKTASVTYQVHLPAPYRLETYQYYGDTSRTIHKVIIENMHQKSLLNKGDRFDLDGLMAERERIDPLLKNQGYYSFNPDYLIFRLDTNQYENKAFDLYLSIKAETPPEALLPYKINKIEVFPDYQVGSEEGSQQQDTSYVDGLAFIQKEESFKPELLRDYILFKPGDIYSNRLYNRTITRLSAIGNYRYVNFRLTPEDPLEVDEEGFAKLKAGIYLSPVNKRALRLEMQALSKSNNFVGPNLLISFRNRNLFRGGESLGVSGKFGFETQFAGGERTGLNSYEFGVESDLVFPRLIVPFQVRQRFGYSVPKTRIALSYSILDRVNLYRFNSIVASLGYQWISSRYTSHEILPLSLNYLNVSRISPRFEEILENNSFLRRSFEQQYIAGLIYSFQFSELVNQNQKHRFFIRFTTDMSGHTLTLLNKLFGGSGSEDLSNKNFAYYTRVDIDLRYYLSPNVRSRLITRVFAGAGFSHGELQTLPYIKQYFSGGPNSIRAFRIRSLGPGTYRPEEENIRSFFDQSGDIKLEGNIEYRFPIVSFLKGALFVDAGNIWLLKNNEDLPGSRFSENWSRELAVGTGFGFRLDFDFFVVRLDLASPIHDPARDGNKWLETFKPFQSDWRKDFLVWNFAIGYPF